MDEPAPFDAGVWPRRLNLGCGWDVRPGYLNVDFIAGHGPDLVADVRDLSMLPAEHYDEVVAQDVLEHLPRSDGPAALREWNRLLVPGGRLVLRVPNILGLAFLCSTQRSVPDQEQLVQCLYGTQAHAGDFHHMGYTELLLRSHLRQAGFGEVELTPKDEWLFDVVATKCEPVGELRYEDCPYMSLGQPSVIGARQMARSRPSQ